MWTNFISVIKGFLGNHKGENYKEIVDDIVDTYRTIDCRMSMKMHVLYYTTILMISKRTLETTQKKRAKDFTRMLSRLRNVTRDS